MRFISKKLRKRMRAIYDTMINNCYNPAMYNYRYYGKRGIKVCPWWKNSFESFMNDVGVKPAGYELIRINKNKNYSPSNVTWKRISKRKEVFYNCKTFVVGYKGIYMKLSEWSVLLGLSRAYLRNRMRRYECSFMACILHLDKKKLLDKKISSMNKKDFAKEHFQGARILASITKYTA